MCVGNRWLECTYRVADAGVWQPSEEVVRKKVTKEESAKKLDNEWNSGHFWDDPRSRLPKY